MARRGRRKGNGSWRYSWWDPPAPPRQELLRWLDPLICQIRRVDDLVDKICRGDGCVGDLVELKKVLDANFTIRGTGGQRVCLAQPVEVRHALFQITRELHLEVHTLYDKYPCYLLCRISSDWDAPDTVLDELHLSARNDFFPDRRFVVLMRGGRSRTFLRLSLFRDKLREYLHRKADDAEETDEEDLDETLETVSKLVLGAAWYEDQRLPFHVADVFGLRRFRAALELVGFVLGSDLYKVSTALRDGNEQVISFFRRVYPNRPVAKLLRRLSLERMHNITNLENEAKAAFRDLNDIFARFLGRSDCIRNLESLALYKIVLGSFYNLCEVTERAARLPALREATETAEAAARDCSRRVLQTMRDAIAFDDAEPAAATAPGGEA